MGEMVSFGSDGGTGKGYLALPPAGPAPGVLVVAERPEPESPGWGLVGHIMSVAERFAEAGFVALAPDLSGCEDATDLEPAARELVGAAEHLAGLPQTSGGGIGAVGFGQGGSLALASATRSDRITTVAAFYPGGAWERLRPGWDRYAGKAATVHSAGDTPNSDIQALYAEITKAGGACTRYDYPGTRYGFFNDDRPDAFAPDAAASAWARTLDTLRTRLG